jgi:hypothetical protein
MEVLGELAGDLVEEEDLVAVVAVTGAAGLAVVAVVDIPEEGVVCIMVWEGEEVPLFLEQPLQQQLAFKVEMDKSYYPGW